MITLHERVTLTLAEAAGLPRVDRANGIIRGVKLLGWHSANGREYDPRGVEASLYERRPLKADHARPGQQRSVRETIGWFEGAHARADGIYARELRLLNPQGELEQRLLGAAEHAPHVFGLSHTAQGKEKAGSGGGIIEKVHKVHSVDLVDDPATVSSLYESGSNKVKKKVRELIEALKPARPKYARALSEMAEAGIMGPDAQMDEPAGDAAPEDEGGDHCAALIDAAKAVLTDDALDTAAKIKKIKQILKMVDQSAAGGGKSGDVEEEDEPEDDEDEPATESKQGRRLAKLEAKVRLRDAADEAGVKLPKTLLESVSPRLTEAQAKALVAELKGTAGGTTGSGARSAPPWVPPATNAQGKPVTEQRQQQAADPDQARGARLATLRRTR